MNSSCLAAFSWLLMSCILSCGTSLDITGTTPLLSWGSSFGKVQIWGFGSLYDFVIWCLSLPLPHRVYMSVLVFVCTHVHEVDRGQYECLPLASITFHFIYLFIYLRKHFLLNLEFIGLARLDGHWSPGICLSLPRPCSAMLELEMSTLHLFLCAVRYLNSDLYSCTAGISTTKPSSQVPNDPVPSILKIIYFYFMHLSVLPVWCACACACVCVSACAGMHAVPMKARRGHQIHWNWS